MCHENWLWFWSLGWWLWSWCWDKISLTAESVCLCNVHLQESHRTKKKTQIDNRNFKWLTMRSHTRQYCCSQYWSWFQDQFLDSLVWLWSWTWNEALCANLTPSSRLIFFSPFTSTMVYVHYNHLYIYIDKSTQIHNADSGWHLVFTGIFQIIWYVIQWCLYFFCINLIYFYSYGSLATKHMLHVYVFFLVYHLYLKITFFNVKKIDDDFKFLWVISS